VGLEEYEQAWGVFQEAFALDPQWISLELDALEALATAALETGRLEEAREYIEFATNNFKFSRDERRIRLLLVYADVLNRLGDRKTAMDLYHLIKKRIGESAKGALVQERLYQAYPEDVARGAVHYCVMLCRDGKVREAMEELRHAWEQCLREGIDIGPLEDAMREIVPAFIEQAMIKGYAFDAMQAWRLFGYAIVDEAQRRRCFLPLVEALEQLGLYGEALGVVEQLEQMNRDEGATFQTRYQLQTACLRYHMGETGEAIEQLEAILAKPLAEELKSLAYEYLAKSYLEAGRELEAAQAYQLLASTPGVDGPLMGEAFLEAARLFLEAEMPMQSVELALQALIYESQSLRMHGTEPWQVKTATQIRMLLARAYIEGNDFSRAAISLEELLELDGLEPSQRIRGLMMLADCRGRLGQLREAMALYEEVAENADAEPMWREVARVNLRSMRWDENHPGWQLHWVGDGAREKP
jgi:tetratricopeptide (TPR) repeat protein